MKVLKEKSREYKGKSYYKYKINIPEEVMNESGFKEGDELKTEVKKGRVVLVKK